MNGFADLNTNANHARNGFRRSCVHLNSSCRNWDSPVSPTQNSVSEG